MARVQLKVYIGTSLDVRERVLQTFINTLYERARPTPNMSLQPDREAAQRTFEGYAQRRKAVSDVLMLLTVIEERDNMLILTLNNREFEPPTLAEDFLGVPAGTPLIDPWVLADAKEVVDSVSGETTTSETNST